eukprot:CAMPEP_0167759668 /NCGR_PEP_ID=MMETSP0110_2-20121227/11149_1 /TAXON_ID=629695 /ORGANISM="Gymnochlora sp., Strain CCMP2014" /LENGTH=417 /DNA_ID=CAMNT_0007646075 /DNA_START=49 /DNA_END=1298 /DNA_ORIENTATION=+
MRCGGDSGGRDGKKSSSFGVNYGNRFIPEDWMGTKDSFYKDVQPQGSEPHGPARLCLADLSKTQFCDRMLSWLNKKIVEEDFQRMQSLGVGIVRVPTGYWNWVTFPDGTTPNGPDRKRMLTLQSLPLKAYIPYFDRIFEYAAKYKIRVMLDLHGAPGSQNGEMHSGLATSSPHFDTKWNMTKATEAIENMAKYASTKLEKDSVYGIQVLNEPNNYPDKQKSHKFLEEYYTNAIVVIRKYLPKSVPVIVFEWTFNFPLWKDNYFGDYTTYGKVLWDTHVYHTDSFSTLVKAENAYTWDLNAIVTFNDKQKCQQDGGVIVGEWSLAGPSFDAKTNQAFATWLVKSFDECCEGCLFWNFDAPIAEWSFTGSADKFGIDWAKISKNSIIERASTRESSSGWELVQDCKDEMKGNIGCAKTG